MKRFSTTITAKTAAVVLFVLLLAASALCGLGTLYLADVDAYDKTTDFADTPLCVGSVYSYLDEAHQRLIDVFDGGIAGDLRQSARERLDALFDPAETNVRLRVLDTETGELLYGVQDVESLTLVAQQYIGWQISSAAPQTVTPTSEVDPSVTQSPLPVTAAPQTFMPTSGATPSVTTPDPTTDNAAEGGAAADNGSTRDDGWETQLLLLGYIDPALPVHDVLASFSALYDRLLAKRYLLPSLCLLFLLLAVLLYVYLLCAAGRRPDDTEGAAQTRVRRIPTDVMYLIWGAAAGALLLLFFNIGNGYFYRFFDYITVSGMVPFVLLLMAGGVSAALLFVGVSMSTAARFKTHTWLSSMLIWRALCWVCRGVRAVCRSILDVLRNIPSLWKVLLTGMVYALYSLLLVVISQSYLNFGFFLLLWIAATAVLLLLLCRAALGFQRLRRGARALAEGDLSHRIETRGMPHVERAFAEDLGRVGEGSQRAVEERMKSERMKTDLITNVSHDLKTPLTSIVNYVELLKKENLQNETAAGYVAVLDRQAQRLKKLTEDIVEASKASSGAINVNLADMDALELLRQCAAEYGERFAAASLTPVLRLPDAPLTVRADGRLLWRVFDNLLGNAVKYALPGTRVYFDAEADGAWAVLSVRNISREPLEKSGDELMERFVRGDASRQAEGSGLGLSIAGSLMALQHGRLTVLPDGDLFRVDARLPLVDAATTQAQES